MNFAGSPAVLAETLLAAAAYLLAGKLGLAVPLLKANVTLIWPPSGIATAWVLLRGRRGLPGIALGSLLTALSTGAPWAFAAAVAVGSPLQASMAATALEELDFDPQFGRLTDVLLFLAAAVVGAPLASAIAGVIGLFAGGLADSPALPRLAAEWWLGDATGVLLITPLIVSFVRPRPLRPLGGRREAAALFALLIASSLAVYGGMAGRVGSLTLSYLCFPLVLWAAARFGLRETTAGLAIVALAGGLGVANGKGLFAAGTVHEGLLELDGFLAVVSVVALLAAAGGYERRAGRAALLAVAADLRHRVAAGDTTLAEADARLAERESWFHSLADNIPQLAWMARPDGAVVWYNRRWYTYTGMVPAECPPSGWPFVHPDHAPGVRDRLRRALASGETWEDTFPLKGADGGYRWFLSRARPLRGADGAIGLWFGTHTDITERRETEQRLRQAKAEAETAREEAERAHAAKSTFLASASHDLRQPVQSLMLFLDLLETRLADHAARPVVDHLVKATDVLRQLLDGLLDVSRLDAGVVDVHPRRVALDALLRDLVDEYVPQAAEHRLRLRLVAAPATVELDPQLLERILRNLLENALRYTRRGGIVIGCRRRAEGLRIEVVDSGVGIPAEHLDDIFDEFFQVGNPARDRAHGLGLGLSVAKRLADLMGWSLTVTSVEGKGSRFALTIPAGHLVADAPLPPPLPANRRALAMVIDDEPLLRTGLRLLLERWGFEVADAGSGAEAVDGLLAAGRCPDLVIADYRLARGETGVEAIGLIAARVGRPRHTYILTGDMASERVAEARLGGHHLLHKPISPDVLQQALALALRAA